MHETDLWREDPEITAEADGEVCGKYSRRRGRGERNVDWTDQVKMLDQIMIVKEVKIFLDTSLRIIRQIRESGT